MTILESKLAQDLAATSTNVAAEETTTKTAKGKKRAPAPKKAPQAQAQVAKVEAPQVLNKSAHGYSFGSNQVFRGYTIAAIIATRCADFKDGRLQAVRAKGDTATLASIIGPSAWGTWKDSFKLGKMSADGVAKMNVSSFERGNYQTTPGVIAQMLSGIKGAPKTVKIKDDKGRDITVNFRPLS